MTIEKVEKSKITGQNRTKKEVKKTSHYQESLTAK
jgi:hypothetical protein